MDAEARRLPLHVAYERDRVQPDRHDAPDGGRQVADERAVTGVSDDPRFGRRLDRPLTQGRFTASVFVSDVRSFTRFGFR